MDTKQLKAKILDLAVHGKLLPLETLAGLKNSPDYEPASKLLEKLRAEKEEKIAKGELKRDKKDSYIFTGDDNRHYEKFADGSVKDIEDEIPFEVPEGWAWCRLGEISNTISSKPYQILEKDIQKKGEFPVISQSANFIEGYTNEKDYVLDKVPVTIFGDHTRNVKYVDFNFVVGADGVKILKCNTNMYPKFFYNMILDASLKIENRGYGRHFQFIDKYLYAIPPLTEQKLIVAEIEKIFNLIDSLETDKSALQLAVKQAKSKILDLAIHGKIVPQDPAYEPAAALLEKLRAEKEAKIAKGELKRDKNDSYIYKSTTDNCHYEKFSDGSVKDIEDEIPFEVPEGWAWCRLPAICEIPITDGTHQTPTYSDKENGIPFLSSKDVTSQKIDWSNIKYITKDLHEELQKRVKPKRNDILLAKNGTTGVAALVETDKVFDIYVTLALIRPTNMICPKFLLFIVNSPFCKNQFNGHLTGIGVPNLHLNDICKTMIPIPPLTEQKRIVSKIEELFEALDKIQSNLV